MKKISLWCVEGVVVFLLLSAPAFAVKEVRFWLRNADGTTNPVVGEYPEPIGIEHSTYLWSQAYGNSDVVTGWFWPDLTNVYYNKDGDPNFWVDCEQFFWSGTPHGPQVGDTLYTTVTDNYGTFNGESRTFAVALDSDEQQDITEDVSLPVELSSFTAIGQNGEVTLR